MAARASPHDRSDRARADAKGRVAQDDSVWARGVAESNAAELDVTRDARSIDGLPTRVVEERHAVDNLVHALCCADSAHEDAKEARKASES